MITKEDIENNRIVRLVTVERWFHHVQRDGRFIPLPGRTSEIYPKGMLFRLQPRECDIYNITLFYAVPLAHQDRFIHLSIDSHGGFFELLL